jgi:hypothetical protein
MAGSNHLEVPGSSFAPINTSAGDRDGNGDRRSRSNSVQSSTSQGENVVSNLGGGTDAVDYARQSSIRIAHQPSRNSLRGSVTPGREQNSGGGYFGLRRNRANSVPSRPAVPTTPGDGPSTTTRQGGHMPDIAETAQAHPDDSQNGSEGSVADGGEDQPEKSTRRLRRARTNINDKKARPKSAEYENQLVDFLDVVGMSNNMCLLSLSNTIWQIPKCQL